MNRVIILLLSVLLSLAVNPVSAQQLDSLTRARLSDKLEEYFSAIETSGAETQIEEADFLISTAQDSLVRQFVALKVYDHYLKSPVMGAESVAIHVLDEWFFSGKVEMTNEIDLLNARIYADFNRQSLIGSQAPELTLVDRDSNAVELFTDDSEKPIVLYFYDSGCAKCRFETPRLVKVLGEKKYPVDVVAVYAGDSREAWDKYISEYFSQVPEVTHLWDPELDSDFQRKYGVLQTPRMYLIDKDRKIVGRGLDAPALETLLGEMFKERTLVYGSTESEELFDRLLGSFPSQDEVCQISQMLEDATLAKGDTLMFKQLAGDYLYYLASRTGQAYREGLGEHVSRYILERQDIWNTADDSLKVVGFAQIMDDLLSKSVPGTRVARLRLEGEYVRGEKSVIKKRKLNKLRGLSNIIIFHTEGCNVCAAEIKAARELAAADKDVAVFMVNVDEMLVSSPELAARLFDQFDLSSLPYIILTDRKGMVKARYVTLQE